MTALSTFGSGMMDPHNPWTTYQVQANIPGKPAHQRTTIDGVTYKVADTREERESALRLVFDAYRKSELIPDNPFGMRVTPYHLLPTSDIFVAKHNGQVVYTVTLISDDDEGMPLEAIFQEEVDVMRQQGLYLAEVSCLAGKEGYFEAKRSFEVFTNLIGLMLLYGRSNSIDRLLLAVHPRHAKYYERFYGCTRHGDSKAYAAVLNNPAVLCSHDFTRLDETRYRLYDTIYSLPFADWELCRQPMNQEDLSYFAGAVTSRRREFVAVGA